MQDRAINSALLHLRRQITRDRGKGLEHVEAILRRRGVPMPPVSRKPDTKMPRRALKRAVLAMPRDGPKTRARIPEALQADGTRPGRATARADNAMGKLSRQGFIERCGDGWRLLMASGGPLT